MSVESLGMLEELEKVFREMNRAQNLDGVFRAALLGLEAVLGDVRARVVPQTFHLTYSLDQCSLDSRFILLEREEDEILKRAHETGQSIVDTTGIDPARNHCCVIPFQGGCLYLDAKVAFSPESVAVSRMVAHQLAAQLAGIGLSLKKSERDPLKTLPNETWFTNQLNQSRVKGFSVISVELDSFQSFRDERGGELADSALREFASFLKGKLDSSDILAQCLAGEFLVMTGQYEKKTLSNFWSNALREFSSVGIGRSYNLTASVGIAVYPDDGNRSDMKVLAQTARLMASRVSDRVLVVASAEFLAPSSTDDPLKHFGQRVSEVVSAAVRECQVRKRPVDPAALIWGFIEKERDLRKFLSNSGLDRLEFRERLEVGDNPNVSFTESTLKVFGLALEFAFRARCRTVGISHLLLAGLADPEAENHLRTCGLEYGLLMARLYREGHLAGGETLLVGELRRERREHMVRPLPKKKPRSLLQPAFGENFSAEVWAILAEAKNVAKECRHNLGFCHLYVAVLRSEGAEIERAIEKLERLDLENVAPSESVTVLEVIDFFRELDTLFKEVTVFNFAQYLRTMPKVTEFTELLEAED